MQLLRLLLVIALFVAIGAGTAMSVQAYELPSVLVVPVAAIIGAAVKITRRLE